MIRMKKNILESFTFRKRRLTEAVAQNDDERLGGMCNKERCRTLSGRIYVVEGKDFKNTA